MKEAHCIADNVGYDRPAADTQELEPIYFGNVNYLDKSVIDILINMKFTYSITGELNRSFIIFLSEYDAAATSTVTHDYVQM